MRLATVHGVALALHNGTNAVPLDPLPVPQDPVCFDLQRKQAVCVIPVVPITKP